MPAYNPDDKFINFLNELNKEGFNKIIVVNDGSRSDTDHYFKEAKNKYNCLIVEHETNKGYGYALKSGGQTFIERYQDDKEVVGAIHCDCDGQHVIEDVLKCATLIRDNDDAIIVGIRDFDDKNVPLKNKIGNKLTSRIFKLFFGIEINDTQCGLRGFSKNNVAFTTLLSSLGFEYTTELLLETRNKNIKIIPFVIKTVYINNNETTHFNPIKDSIRIYSLIFKYKFKHEKYT